MKISACMMVKNEEEMLPRALESIKDEVDEIVVVDTGSTDRTVEIARQYTDRIYYHEWFDDFSGMRNITLSYVTGDFILILDADDEFRRQRADLSLKAFLEKPLCNIYRFQLENVRRTNVPCSTFNQIRLFRNHMGFSYRGIVHNQFDAKGERIGTAPFLILHYGYGLDEEKMELKRQRSERLLEKMIEQGDNVAFAHYQLAKIHASRKDSRKSLESALKAHQVMGEDPKQLIYQDVHYLIAANAFNLDDLETAFEETRKMLNVDPNNMDAAFILLGYYYEKKDWENLLEYYPIYLKGRKTYVEHPESFPYIINMGDHHPDAVYMYAEALIRSGRVENLEDEIKDLIEDSKRAPYFLNLLAAVLLECGKRGKAESLLETALRLNPGFDPARNNLAALRRKEETEDKVLEGPVKFHLQGVPLFKARQRLEVGAKHLGAGQFDAAEPCLVSVLEIVEKGEVIDPDRAGLLAPAFEGLAVIARKRGDNERSLEYFSKALKLEPNRLDARLQLAELLKSKKKFNEALEHAKAAVVLAPESSNALLTRALVHREAGNLREAEKDLLTLVKMHPEFPLGAFNLGSLYWAVGRRLDALHRLGKAMRTAPEQPEYARAYFDAQRGVKRYPTISLCMMVKNEETHLEECLASVVGAVDEIVVVDTGSEDRTVEIAQSYGARVYHHPWFDDFSGMRNITLSYARGEWILIMDGDESLEPEDADQLRKEAGDLSRQVVTLRVLNYLDCKKRVAEQNSIRLIRNTMGFHYRGIVHNELWYYGAGGASKVRIHHYGYDISPEKKQQKFDRTASLLEKRIQRNPDDLDAHYYLISSYRSVGRLDDALREGYQVLQLSKQRGVDLRNQFYADVYPHLGFLHIVKGDWQKALPVLEEGLEVCPEHPELQVDLAYCRFQAGNYDAALSHLEKAYDLYLKFRLGEIRPFYSVTLNDTQVVGNIANILLEMNREPEAMDKVENICRAVEDMPQRGLENVSSKVEKDDLDGARWELRWLRLAKPTEHGFVEKVGEWTIKLGQAREASLYFDRLQRVGWELSGISRALWGLALAAGGEMDRAEKEARRAVELLPNVSEPLLALTQVLEGKGQYEEAAETLVRLSEIHPDEPHIFNRIGENYYLAHRFDLAERFFVRELKEGGGSADPLNNLGVLYMGQRDFERARDHFERCLVLDPRHTEAMQNLEVCLRVKQAGKRESQP
ncbi:MAG: tetratricopeptide repeat protein [Deltaproteobacteria bacterium]|nr:tetratricopeptide repeat protein [Deltaproteobacteria bacterium]